MLYLQAGEVGLVVMAQTMSVKAIVLLENETYGENVVERGGQTEKTQHCILIVLFPLLTPCFICGHGRNAVTTYCGCGLRRDGPNHVGAPFSLDD